MTDRIPALVVSGFLGSGKTTLVRHLLESAQRSGVRVAIISNEIGELGVDRALLGGGGEAFVELEGGCVCCELSDDLVRTMQQLYEEVRPDRIVIETSGAALPFDTQLNFWREPVSDWVGDDMAVVVVNAEQILEGRDLEGTFEDQVHSADLLVLNKLDLVATEEHDAIETRLRQLEDEAPIVRAVHGRVETALLFPPDREAPDRAASPPRHDDLEHDHYHDRFTTDVWAVPAGITQSALESRLREDDALLRAKGFVELEGVVHLVQLVGRRLEIEPSEPLAETPSLGKLVLISRA